MDPKYLLLFMLVVICVNSVEGWWTSRRRRRRCVATNCLVSNWSGWNACTQNCGSGGVKTRNRRVTRGASCGGGCYPLSETIACNRKCCPLNCAWNWSNWGACQGCGTGTRSRNVGISTNPSCGGAACPSNSQTQSCNTGRYVLPSYKYCKY